MSLRNYRSPVISLYERQWDMNNVPQEIKNYRLIEEFLNDLHSKYSPYPIETCLVINQWRNSSPLTLRLISPEKSSSSSPWRLLTFPTWKRFPNFPGKLRRKILLRHFYFNWRVAFFHVPGRIIVVEDIFQRMKLSPLFLPIKVTAFEKFECESFTQVVWILFACTRARAEYVMAATKF